MNPNSFEKLIKSIKSCRTQDQYITVCDWLVELRQLYNLSGKQNAELNEEFLRASVRIGGLGYEQIYYEGDNIFANRKYRHKSTNDK